MAAIYNSVTNQPQGFSDITIDLVVYVVNSGGAPVSENRLVTRTDGEGNRADWALYEGEEPIVFEMELQKALTTTVSPPAGEEVTHDFDGSGTPSTIVTMDGAVNRSKTDMTTFTQRFILKTYQA